MGMSIKSVRYLEVDGQNTLIESLDLSKGWTVEMMTAAAATDVKTYRQAQDAYAAIVVSPAYKPKFDALVAAQDALIRNAQAELDMLNQGAGIWLEVPTPEVKASLKAELEAFNDAVYAFRQEITKYKSTVSTQVHELEKLVSEIGRASCWERV